MALGLGLSAGITSFGATPATPENPSGAPGAAPNNSQNQNWQDQFTDRMQHIQQEMDNLFRDSMNNIDTVDKGFFGPKFDASATVQDRGDNYVATFNLPKRDLSNVKIKVKDDVLSVSASAEQTTKSDATAKNGQPAGETEMLNEYEQLVTLPGPVDAAKMKIDKTGDSVTVTIPKKSDKTASAK